MPIALVLLLLGFSAVDARVLSPANLLNVAQQTSYLALFAMAQTVVILTRGFDLSLGPTVSVVSVASAMALAAAGGAGLSPVAVLFLGLLAGLAIGLAVGAFNGVVVALLGVSPFVATLGSYNIAIGVATTISGGRPVQGVPDLFSDLLYRGSVFGVPAAIAIAVLAAVLLHLALTRTVFGRSLYLVGTNPRAAGVAGLPVKRVLALAYLLCSGLAALGALMMTARTGSGEPNLGGSLSLQAIAAAVVGGTSLAGGRGGVGTAVLGALFVTILSNGMNLARIDGYVQMVVLGAIVILGVVLDRARLSGR
nr:ABC transporter permease [Aureimonas sp. AU20]